MVCHCAAHHAAERSRAEVREGRATAPTTPASRIGVWLSAFD